MSRRFKKLTGRRDEGQALVLLCFMIMVVLGAAGMSVDVGRAYWAKTQVQAAVDSAALAGAAGLPNTATAGALADQYWNLNNGFLRSQGSNVTLAKTYSLAPSKIINVTGSADVDTWFARVLGIDKWHVTASASAEFQQVDAMRVLDRSGSMCYDSHGDGNNGYFNKNVRLGAAVNSTATTFSISKISGSTAALTSYLWVGQRFQLGTVSSSGTTSPSGGNPTEWMQITAINTTNNTITVTRKVNNPNTNATSQAGSHSSNDRIIGTTCPQAGNANYYPWQYIKDGGVVFVNNMNSTYDQIGYVDFGSKAVLDAEFTTGFATLKTKISGTLNPSVADTSNLNGDNDNSSTNIAHGIWYGVNRHLASPYKRADVYKVIVLLSDGAPNYYCSNAGSASTQSATCTATSDATKSKSWSLAAADYAKANNIVIYTISYGSAADTSLMADIATRTGGKHFITPNEATLNVAFQEIAKSTHVKLTK